jgi:hypothetical protein
MQTVSEKYQLHTLIERDALLLASMLYESGQSHDEAMNYILTVPGMLDIPQVLAMLTEWLRYTDDSLYAKRQRQLTHMAQSGYQAKNFHEHMKTLVPDIIHADDTSDMDKAYMLMAIGHMNVIKRRSSKEIQKSFFAAAQYGLAQ